MSSASSTFYPLSSVFVSFFFFQAEDGIRDDLVTGVQTCALPISIGTGLGDLARADVARGARAVFHHHVDAQALCKLLGDDAPHDISATACRERYNQRDLPVWPGRLNQAGSDQENTSEKKAAYSLHWLDS